MKEYEETVKDALKLHDKLLGMELEWIAEDALRIHDNLLEIKEKNLNKDIHENISLFLRDDTGHIYGNLGSRIAASNGERSGCEPFKGKISEGDLQKDKESYRLFLQNIRGFIGLWLDENLVPTFIDGAVNEITGYSKEEFHFMNLKWTELVLPEDLQLYLKHVEYVKSNPNSYAEIDYRIRRKDREIRWLREVIQILPENYKSRGTFQSFVRDFSEQKQAEENSMKFENAQKKEIHHRIKNNLQVVSSLLDLQAEKLAGNNVCDTSRVLEAFKETKNRVASMSLIHEELYISTDMNSQIIDFSSYLKKLTESLFDSYNLKNYVSLKLSLEQINLGIDTAVPLGIVVNELISNSLKHAFPNGNEREISVLLCKKENYKQYIQNSGNFIPDFQCQGLEDLQFVLVIKDNGIGFPKEIDFKNTDSLGLQIVTTLIEQIDGCIDLQRNNGTEFIMSFKDVTNMY